jgi:hypothetical protein
MLLSVIITNFNYAKYIEASIRSALLLDYRPKEIIVVDDGSTDGSRAIIDRVAADHPPIIRVYQPNQGMISALNAGYLASSGDLVFFLDSDDLVDPDMMQEVMRAWHPGASKAQFFQRVIAGETGTDWCNRFPKTLTNHAIRRELLRTGAYPWPPTSGNVYSRRFLRIAAPLDPARRLHDTALNTLAPLYGDVVLVPKILGSYRMHGKNAVGKSEVDVRVARQHVLLMVERDRLLLEHAARLGLETNATPRDHDLTSLIKRITSLRLGRQTHPIQGDTAIGILARAVSAARDNETMRPADKAAIAAWFALMAVAPPSLCRTLAREMYVPTARPRALVAVMRFLGLAKKPEADRADLPLSRSEGAA